MSAGKILIKRLYKNVAAVVIKLNSGYGAVRIFVNEDTVAGNHITDPLAKDAALLVVFRPNYFCWLMSDARVKMITPRIS